MNGKCYTGYQSCIYAFRLTGCSFFYVFFLLYIFLSLTLLKNGLYCELKRRGEGERKKERSEPYNIFIQDTSFFNEVVKFKVLLGGGKKKIYLYGGKKNSGRRRRRFGESQGEWRNMSGIRIPKR